MNNILFILSCALLGANIFLFFVCDKLYKKCYDLTEVLNNERNNKE